MARGPRGPRGQRAAAERPARGGLGLSASEASGTLRPRDGITWATDAHRVVVAGADGGRATVLEGHHATVWSWISMSPSERRLVEMVAVLLRLERAEAAERVRDLLLAWREAGLLEPAGDEVP